MILDTLNPFDPDCEKGTLFNIGTGKAGSTQTEAFLLHVLENGDNLRKKFIEECIQDTTRFEKPIKKQKIHAFAEDNAKYTVTSADKKLQEALEKKVDM